MASQNVGPSASIDVALWSHYQNDDPAQFEGGHARQDFLYRRIRGRIGSGRLLEISVVGCDGLLPFADASFDGVIALSKVRRVSNMSLLDALRK